MYFHFQSVCGYIVKFPVLQNIINLSIKSSESFSLIESSNRQTRNIDTFIKAQYSTSEHSRIRHGWFYWLYKSWPSPLDCWSSQNCLDAWSQQKILFRQSAPPQKGYLQRGATLQYDSISRNFKRKAGNATDLSLRYFI